jgi:hypothetical protein
MTEHVCKPPKARWWFRLGREWTCPQGDSIWTLTLFSKGLLVQQCSRRWVVTEWLHVRECPLFSEPGTWITDQTIPADCQCPASVTNRVEPPVTV